MAALKSSQQIHQQLEKQWQQGKFHQAYLLTTLGQDEELFPYIINLPKPTNKQWLHNYDQVQSYLTDMAKLTNKQGFSLEKQLINYASMGKQVIPCTISITNIETLAKYLNKWQAWQKFMTTIKLITKTLPQLQTWLIGLSRAAVKEIEKYQTAWPKLINVCQYFIKHPQPQCYIRQLNIVGIDTKFIEQHKGILKNLLDHLLPTTTINNDYEKLVEHGFEKRFGLLYEQPQVRFRLLDSQLTGEFSGISDLTLPIEQFQQLNLMLDRVFITENKINGLAFPAIKNALVIFGLGYGVQILKPVHWLNACEINYWGDIDTHGFAILSQLRGYFPKTKSLLMDETTLLACKKSWGQESSHKSHKAELLANLNHQEQTLYKNLKKNKWQVCLRLEQELIPFSLLEQTLQMKLKL